MENLSIDLETFSSVDLKKCGVYKYAESDDFEILLFGYSVDGSEVKVVDLAQGEAIPEVVLSAESTTSGMASPCAKSTTLTSLPSTL